jgi:hypothetical protein
MPWDPWPRINRIELARYVTPESATWLRIGINRFDLEDNRQKVIEALYEALLAKNIRYVPEKYHPADNEQIIRTPSEILDHTREGTCLDLATLFCGLCLANELLPILIVLKDHALAAVSLVKGRREWDAYGGMRSHFEDGPVTDVALIRTLVDTGAYIAVECTGFAQSDKLGTYSHLPEGNGRVDGVLPFKRAITAGHEQLVQANRPFQFALEIAVAHEFWRVHPFPLISIYEIFGRSQTLVSREIKTEEFRALVRNRVRNFKGRDFIFRAIDKFLKDPTFPSGYIVVKGEPGIGKTAIISRLVQTRNYVHHFNIPTQNIRSPRDFLGNICAQLITRYDLDYNVLPQEAKENSLFLSKLLAEARIKMENEPLVVLVDALDEADGMPNDPQANRLFLPPHLPDGVFFIVTARLEEDLRLSVDRRQDIYLDDKSQENLTDIIAYVTDFIEMHSEDLSPRLIEWEIDAKGFASTLTERSEGNFMYLVYVLEDILRGRITKKTVDDIRHLPAGLKDYYMRHWNMMKASVPNEFEGRDQKIVCLLATVREPVSVDQLEEWTDLPRAYISNVISAWLQFLDEHRSASNDTVYRVYHASFQDFLQVKIGLKPYHALIVRKALAKIPGLADI